MQLGRGETIADTAKVLSRFVDGIMIRAKNHDDLMELAQHATVPVINGLTNKSHPCQIMADILTLEEHVGPLGRTDHCLGWGWQQCCGLLRARGDAPGRQAAGGHARPAFAEPRPFEMGAQQRGGYYGHDVG